MKKSDRHSIAVLMVVILAMLACSLQSGDTSTSSATQVVPTEVGSPTDIPNTTPDETQLIEPTATETPVITPTPTVEATLGIGSMMVNPVDGAAMVYVPEGEFLMGSENGHAWDDEKPQHLVYLDAFWLYQHPVTNAQFAAFVDASGHHTTSEETGWAWVWDGSNWVQTNGAYWGAPEGLGSSVTGREDHPVVHVSWFDAVAYCEWAGGRLPTEAEWEKAARGTDGRRFPWGDDPVTADRGNFCDVNCPMDWVDKSQDDGYERTSPVGSYPAGASPYGALDMAGNVWEWVADLYESDYYRRSPAENPTGPTSGEFHVLRGGSWSSFEGNLRVSNRGWYCPGCWYFINGFRCLRSP